MAESPLARVLYTTETVRTKEIVLAVEEPEQLRAEFLAMVSPEPRLPLTSIRGAAIALLESEADLDPAEMRQFHRVIVARADRMRELIGDLLYEVRIETSALPVDSAPVEVAALVDQARNTVQGAGARNNLELDVVLDLPRRWRTAGAWSRSSATCCPTRLGTRPRARSSG